MHNEELHTEEFVRFLQEGTANFKMFPSRKIWYGIYNDMHPARRWPSMAVCLLLLTSLIYLGINNNNSLSKKDTILHAQRLQQAELYAANNDIFEPSVISHSVAKQSHFNTALYPVIANENISSNKEENIDFITSKDEESATIGIKLENNSISNSIVVLGTLSRIINKVEIQSAVVINSAVVNGESNLPATFSSAGAPELKNKLSVEEALATMIPYGDKKKDKIVGLPEKTKAAISANSNIINDESETVTSPIKKAETEDSEKRSLTYENTLTKFKTGKKGIFSKANSINYYLTPSIGFRTLQQGSALELPAPAQAVVVNSTQPTPPQNINNKVTQQYAINLEAGATVLFPITKRLSLSSGVQINYTNYEISAKNLGHTIQTDMALRTSANSGVLVTKASTFANTLADHNATLNNSTTQLSVPVGVQYRILGNKNVQWLAGASLQPTYTIGGNAYVLSADNRNYISAPDMLRRFNANVGFESYLSIATGKGVRFIIGPQLRYQILSNYKNTYNFTEKLYNAGVKVGLNKSF